MAKGTSLRAAAAFQVQLDAVDRSGRLGRRIREV